MRHPRSKKGVDLLMMAFGTLIIALAALLIFISVANKFTKSDDFLLSYHTEDFQLLFETVQAVPGNVAVPYKLTKGFQLELLADRFRIVEEETDIGRERWLHLIQGMRTEEGVGVGEFKIIKENNVIRIGGGTLFIDTNEDCLPPMRRTGFSVSTKTGSSTATGIQQEDVQAVKDSIDYYLARNGIDTGMGTDTFFLTITMLDNERPTLTVMRPNADAMEDADYAYLLCEIGNAFGDSYEIKESFQHTTNRLQAELFIELPPEQQRAFLSERAAFANKLALLLKAFQETEKDETT